ncbi:spermidine synthase [Paenarthrobacter aurescens]|uniref:spermidine synthase n=1 Tax=Paenarthrobacter aurescens TaxID=43663 RepID=UPI00157FFA98|nr:fused MFS/spermidine synthase [Paenarthrobacter aurescens]MDO6143903.1 fused MFS/spermidine synthase [Paenarthrobacter aurescens]MDO6147750.1 fused MFS/spermidine synthase [Paenarthrobacter aurescens]MDO6158994.1 fused MFS/spermidine synthase [Paenarthrobacter aurescens]MDO6162978.1 fused MFS/spermidine synthase [Paenarthrobacter aurescens]
MNAAGSGQHHATRFLRTTGQHATIEADTLVDGGYILSIGGAEQSHVNLADPSDIFYEYLRRIGHVVDLAAEPGRPIRALHLGAGALTLARYIQATRPGSEQYAVELERELLDFVLQKLPMPEGTVLTTQIGDARESLVGLPDQVMFDVVILDIFSGPEAPEHIACREFYEEAAARLQPEGILIINVGDEPALTLVRSQVAALRQAMTDVAAFAEAGMFAGRYPGNIVLVGTGKQWPSEWTTQLLARGPHPAKVLTGVELDSISA